MILWSVYIKCRSLIYTKKILWALLHDRNMVRISRFSLSAAASWLLWVVTHRRFDWYQHFEAECRSHLARYPVGNSLIWYYKEATSRDKLLLAGLSQRRHGFNPRSFLVGFEVNTIAQGQAFSCHAFKQSSIRVHLPSCDSVWSNRLRNNACRLTGYIGNKYIYNANKYYRINVSICKITSFKCDILLLFKNNSEDCR